MQKLSFYPYVTGERPWSLIYYHQYSSSPSMAKLEASLQIKLFHNKNLVRKKNNTSSIEASNRDKQTLYSNHSNLETTIIGNFKSQYYHNECLTGQFIYIFSSEQCIICTDDVIIRYLRCHFQVLMTLALGIIETAFFTQSS